MAAYYRASAELIASFEGFVATARWDVNAWRCGYGSDTIGAAMLPVHRGSVTNHTEALDNLEMRIPIFEKEIIRQVGAAWTKVPPNMKPPLISIAYNYGHLPRDLPDFVCSQSWGSLAFAIEGLESDNGGVNRKRRAKEASLVRAAIPA